MSQNSYAPYQTAKTLSTEKECIKINELADKELIEDITFKAIINSTLINRYGTGVFCNNKIQIKEENNCNIPISNNVINWSSLKNSEVYSLAH